MIAVIFEVTPAPGQHGTYLDIAASLRADLNAADGFISVEQFESLSTRGKFCRYRSGAMRLRCAGGVACPAIGRHRRQGAAGCSRVAVAGGGGLHDYGMQDRDQVPGDSLAVFDL